MQCHLYDAKGTSTCSGSHFGFVPFSIGTIYSWNIANVGVKQQSLTLSTGSGTYQNYIIHVNEEETRGDNQV